MLRITGLSILLGAALVPAVCQTYAPSEVPALIPSYKYVQTLVSSTQLEGKTYPAFPVLLRLSETDLLIGFKRGYAHVGPEADFEILHFNPTTERLDPHAVVLHQAGINLQNGEFARFSNGDIACFLDAIAPDGSDMGLREYRSTDDGQSFRDLGKLGVIDGVEYGYAFEAVTTGHTTRMLVMTFANLPGGRPVSPIRQKAGSVDVISTDDNGKTWHFVRSLSHEFGGIQGGIQINESSFTPYGNGFLTATRGYDNRQWVQRTDGHFRLQKQVDLTTKYPFVRSYVGRPRIFEHDGGYYLLGRNWTENGPMKLCLFRLNPDTLAITKQVILDNAESENVIDGYYAVPYWQERNGRSFLNVITYKRVASRDDNGLPIQIRNDMAKSATLTRSDIGRFPDIIRLEFDWDEVR